MIFMNTISQWHSNPILELRKCKPGLCNRGDHCFTVTNSKSQDQESGCCPDVLLVLRFDTSLYFMDFSVGSVTRKNCQGLV